MLRTARMVRLAILAPHTRERDVIETLHAARIFHFEEYTEGRHPELDIGEPLEEGSRASEQLVRIRALLRHLGLEGDEPPETTHDPAEVRGRLDEALVTLETNVSSAVEARDRIARELEDRIERRGRLEPLQGLGVDLEDLSGYESVRVFVGEADPDVARDVAAVTAKATVVRGPDAQAVFAPVDDAERVSEVLSEAGFQELEVPEGEGPVGQNLAQVGSEIEALRSKLEGARAELDRLRDEYGEFLLAADEDLSIEVEKAEAPLSFGHSERVFVVDAWVPAERVTDVEAQLEAATEGAVHTEVIDEGGRTMHREDEPPAKYQHSKPVGPFSYFLDLFSRPKYDEIDPTIILFIVFPLFFGFMIGDMGYGLIMTALGLWMVQALGGRSEAASGLGTGMFLAGIWATLFGLVVFHDVFGIPFVVHTEAGLSWFLLDDGHGHIYGRGLLGMTVSEHSWLANPIIEKLAATEAHTLAELGHPFGASQEFLGVKAMLALSIMAAFVHLTLGFLFGFFNHFNHSKKHAFAQVGWLGVLIGFYALIQFLMPENAISHLSNEWMGIHGAIPTWVLAALAGGAGILLITEGLIGLFETLTLLAHTVSYTRLAGVAVAKAAMAGAFNGLFLTDMVLDGSGALVVVGIVLFIVAQMLVLVLGILSSGIQAIRLNYVEFFLKFFQGGGEPFKPFGRQRRYTHPTTQ